MLKNKVRVDLCVNVHSCSDLLNFPCLIGLLRKGKEPARTAAKHLLASASLRKPSTSGSKKRKTPVVKGDPNSSSQQLYDIFQASLQVAIYHPSIPICGFGQVAKWFFRQLLTSGQFDNPWEFNRSPLGSFWGHKPKGDEYYLIMITVGCKILRSP